MPKSSSRPQGSAPNPQPVATGTTENLLGQAGSQKGGLATQQRYRIGDYEFRNTDHTQVQHWAQKLGITPEEVVQGLVAASEKEEIKFHVEDGAMVGLVWDFDLFPLTAWDWVAGLEIVRLGIKNYRDIGQELPTLPECLRELDCSHNSLTKLDLTPVPGLQKLDCSSNKLTKLDLTPVPALQTLQCWSNNLTKLDLTPMLGLQVLGCGDNKLTELDLTPVPALQKLNGSENLSVASNPSDAEKLDAVELSKGRTSFFWPTLLPNGAMLIRNDHRVLAIDDSPSLRLQVSNTKLRTELAKVLQNINPQADNDDAVVQFSIIHRQPDGSFIQTRTLPEQLSDWGQTLVFIGNDLDLSASDLLSDADISSVCENSRTGTGILRVFADFALVYGDYRANDEFDTTIDSYDVHCFGSLDEPEAVKVSQDLDYVTSWVASRTKDRIEESELESSESDSETENQVEAITSFTPFFHESPNQPVHYYAAHDPYWTLSEQFGHKLAVVEVPMEAFSDIDDFEHNFCEAIETRLLDEVDFPAHQRLLLTEDINGHQGKECAHALDTEAAKAWIKARANEMRQQFSQAMENDPDSDESDLLNDILFDGYVRVRVALVFDAKPDYVQLNGLMKQLSGQIDAGGKLSVPCVGFYQGYDCGGYDTGNAPVLLTPQEIEDEDEDEDDE